MNNPTSTYLLLEARLGEPLDDYVLGERRKNTSWNAIALDLHTKTQLPVTSETLRIWFFEADKALEKTA